jgi:AraC-like DNA-binding protein
VRTLQRRLAADGTTFRDIPDSLRRGLAEAYLGDPHVSIAEVAFLLGFSDQTDKRCPIPAQNRTFKPSPA